MILPVSSDHVTSGMHFNYLREGTWAGIAVFDVVPSLLDLA